MTRTLQSMDHVSNLAGSADNHYLNIALDHRETTTRKRIPLFCRCYKIPSLMRSFLVSDLSVILGMSIDESTWALLHQTATSRPTECVLMKGDDGESSVYQRSTANHRRVSVGQTDTPHTPYALKHTQRTHEHSNTRIHARPSA